MKYSKQYIENVSMPDPAAIDTPTMSKMVSLVTRMLDLHKKLPKAKGAAKTSIERQITATDRQIDALVYELYGLTEKEVRLVEEGIR